MSLKSFQLTLLCGWILTALSAVSFGQTLEWAKQMGGAEWDEGTAIKTDQFNNVYTVGLFIGTVDFDPGAGVFNLTSVGEKDAFICKLDASGNFLWAKQYGDSAAIDENTSLGLDSLGNLYITNSFLGTADFDPGPGSFYLTSQSADRNIFVQKLDAQGNFIWAKRIGATNNPGFPTPTHSYAISVDATGNLFLTGYFDGTVDFDPDTTFTFNMTSQFNASDIFICKLDSDGHFIWAKQFTGTQSQGGVGYAIVVDGSGNVYSTGTIGGTMDFDPGPGTFFLTTSVTWQTEIYVSKLDAMGNFLWALPMGPGEGSAIATDDNGDVYSSGWTPAGFAPLINKIDASGNILWAKQLGGINGNSIQLDSNGNVYTTGICFGTNDFDPGPGVFILSGGNSDSYISVLDSLGNFVWAGLYTGTNQVWVNAATIDQNNNCYTTGFFNGTADFDPFPTIFNLTSPAIGYDIFINKLNVNVVLGHEDYNLEENIKIYPNPTKGYLVLELMKEYDGLNITVRNILGQPINTTMANNNGRIEIQIHEESGIYLLELTDQNNMRRVKKIIMD